MSQTETERNLGTQPLETIMNEWALGNHDLVAACEEPLTHKAVQRARKGRRLTPKVQRKVVAALNAVCRERGAGEGESKVFAVSDLFNYHG